MDNLTIIPIKNLTILFAFLVTLGTLLSLTLFKFNVDKFLKSSLSTKVAMWVPLYIIFILVLYSNIAKVLIVALVIFKSFREISLKLRKRFTLKYQVYWLLFILFFLHVSLVRIALVSNGVGAVIIIAFSSVISDVIAFFFGNSIGKHKLPKFLNDTKSYEGVIGQIIGAFVGVLLVKQFVIDVLPIYVFIPIGIGNILGDLTNSFMKRMARVKDWGNGIPGHGGYLDRFSSLAAAFALSYYYILLTQI